jgi:hypothetical protein
VFTFKCSPDGAEPFTVKTGSRAITAWENAPGQPKSQPRRSISTLAEAPRMTDLTDLAWYAASRAGLTSLDIREWQDQVDIDVRKNDEDEDSDGDGGLDPTQSDR